MLKTLRRALLLAATLAASAAPASAADVGLLSSWGTGGSEAGQLGSASQLATDGQGVLHALDPDTGRVQRFAPDGSWLGGWSTFGDGVDRDHPSHDIAVAADGTVYVIDSLVPPRVRVF